MSEDGGSPRPDLNTMDTADNPPPGKIASKLKL